MLDFRQLKQMHRTRIREPRAPHFLRREHQHRCGIAHQRVEQRVQHRAIGAALRVRKRIAIEAVLANIEEEGRKVLVAEISDLARVGVEIVIERGLPQPHPPGLLLECGGEGVERIAAVDRGGGG